MVHGRSRNGARGILVASFVLFAASTASGQGISSLAITKNAGNTADNFQDGLLASFQRTSTTAIVSSSTTAFQTRYAFVVGTDTGAFTSQSNALTSDYRVEFDVTAPGGYRLTINTNRNGALTRVDDGTGSATADTSNVTASYTGSGTLTGGPLTLGDPAGSSGSGSANTAFDASTAVATIVGVSNGSTVSQRFDFAWTSSCNSNGSGLSGITGGDECAVRGGIAITYGGETAGDYPGSGSRTQANDGHFLNVSFVSLCGNSIVDGDVGEQCDEGGANGTSGSCCTSTCQFRSAGAGCRGIAGQCDQEETCTGSSGSCPADTFLPVNTVCRAASPGELCDETEVCTGTGPNCPSDEVKPNGEVCRTSAGACDLTETCDGASKLCPNDDKVPNGTICRAQNGDCDVAEVCNGVGNLCPSNGFQTPGFVCRASAGDCDIQEVCTGGPNCPADAFESSSVICRADAGECDVQENCPGNGPNCPANAFEPSGTSCTDDGLECTDDECNGSGSCVHPNEPQGTPCTSDGETCTVDECDGSGACSHPAGNAGTECRAASVGQLCDEPEQCDGTNPTCPADSPKTAGVECRAASAGQECDEPEQCDGINFQCPTDGVKTLGTLCRADSGECDVDDFCDGVNFDCPADGFEPSGTPCTADSETCTADICDGNNNCTHPAGNAGTECRAASVGQLCDEPEECDGTNPTCPADAPKSAGIECRAASVGQECDEAEECDGSSFQCPPDGVKPLGTVCRADTGECDVQEVCDGSGFDCPADAFEISGTPCSSDGEICTLDQCDGNNTCTHPAGNAGATCRADAGECDVAEQCDGTNPSCPANSFEPDGTSCTDDGLFCSGDESCQAGSCTSAGDPCTSGVCNEPTDQCLTAGCETTPLAGCRTALKSILVVKDNATNDGKDKLIWKWLKGASTTQTEFGDPTTTADYTLCVYTGAGQDLVAEAVVPPNGMLWKPISTKGYKYKDQAGSQTGITKVILKGSLSANKSKALVKGKGMNLDDIPAASNPTLDLDLPVLVQLVNEDNGICFEADYQPGDIKKNIPGKFKAKAQ